MTRLTRHAEQIADDLAHQHGFGIDAVRHMIRAVDAGWGGMASFDHPEFGGPGQWMQGGMIMLSEPFDATLRAKVDALCNEIAGVYETGDHLVNRTDPAARGPSWPVSLGTPAAAGSQDDTHYAYFPETRRLALMHHGHLQIFDTGDHRITGVAQQQSDTAGDVRFTSQNGDLNLDSLTPVSTDDVPAQASAAADGEPAAPRSADEITRTIERLGELRERGLLTEDEFIAKKTELLERL